MKKTYISIFLVSVLLLLFLAAGLLVLRNSDNNTANKETINSTEIVNVASQEPSGSYKENGEVELNNDESVKIIISSAEFIATGDLLVKTQLYGIADGECDLKITNSEVTVEKIADIIFAPEYSSCEGYVIAKDELQNGDLVLNLTVNSNNESYNSEPYVVKK